ncbi:MAG TPA: polysaccharide deacetylase family protein [Candidatus Limnocylindrales bacterium]
MTGRGRVRRAVTLVALAMAPLLVGLAAAPGGTVSAEAPPGAGIPAVLGSCPAAGHAVALTFDDGWDETTTRRLVERLLALRAPATFFPQGSAVRRWPALWRWIAASGFPLADHTEDHPDLTRLPAAEAGAEVAAGLAAVASVAATGRPPLAVLRPPYGALDPAVLRAAADAGIRLVVLWDVYGGDSEGWPASKVAAAAEAGGDGSIIVLHAGPPATVAAIDGIVADYRARGFELVTLPDLLARAGGAARCVLLDAPAVARPTS